MKNPFKKFALPALPSVEFKDAINGMQIRGRITKMGVREGDHIVVQVAPDTPRALIEQTVQVFTMEFPKNHIIVTPMGIRITLVRKDTGAVEHEEDDSLELQVEASEKTGVKVNEVTT